MPGIMEIMQMCRLCLVKDQVNISIFDEKEDLRQIFLKITTCLPVKVEKDDKLPKKICDGCSYKLELLYQFVNTSVNAEKQLLTWLGETKKSSKSQEHPSVEAVVLKQEIVEPPEVMIVDTAQSSQNYVLQEENLPYESFEYEPSVDVSAAAALAEVDEHEMPSKRPRLAPSATVVSQGGEESDDDNGVEERIAKIENESEPDEDSVDAQQPQFISVASTSVSDQPGPSGVQKPVDPTCGDILRNLLMMNSTKRVSNIGNSSHSPFAAKQNEPNSAKATYDKLFECLDTYEVDNRSKELINQPKRVPAETTPILLSLLNNQKKINNNDIPKPTNQFICKVCNAKFSRISGFKRHCSKPCVKNKQQIESESDEESLIDDEEADADYVESDEENVINTSSNKPSEANQENVCSVCFDVLKTPEELKEHMLLHDGDVLDVVNKEIIVVDFDNDSIEEVTITSKETSIKENLLTFNEDDDLAEISESEDTFQQQSKNIQTILNGNLIKCSICKQLFPTETTFLAHSIQEHANHEPQVFCIPCNTHFQSITLHTDHLRSSVRTSCNICLETFPNAHERNVHTCRHESYRRIPFTIRRVWKDGDDVVEKHACRRCGKWLKESQLGAHLRRKHGDTTARAMCKENSLDVCSVELHKRNSNSEKIFRCCVCEEGFVGGDDLWSHCVGEHGLSNFAVCCIVCGVRLQSGDDLESHLKSDGVASCDLCSMSFTNEHEMNVHKFAHKSGTKRKKCTLYKGGELIYFCGLCRNEFKLVVDLRKHIKSEHPNVVSGGFGCSSCQYVFYDQDTLKNHVKRVKKGQFTCLKCNLIFETHDEKLAHNKTHYYQCNECEKRFSYEDGLRRHKIEDHGSNEGKQHKCVACNKTFYFLKDLKNHKSNVHKSKGACEICGKFVTAITLKRHMKLVHGNLTKSVCTLCGKSVKCIRQHMLHHNGKKFTCPQCGKIFAAQNGVDICLNKHNGVKRYKCNLCEKKFFYPGSLIVHKRIHSGEKPFKCTVCERSFYTEQILYKHMLSHGIDTRAAKKIRKSH